jgi:hypothetical protein
MEADDDSHGYHDDIPVIFGHYWMKGKPFADLPRVSS